MIRCDDLDELMEAAELIAGCGRLGRSVGGGRTGVVTVSTGEASLVADLAARTGLDLPPVPDDARAAILRDLPTMGYIGNPLDPWGADEAPPAYGASFEALAASGAYDVLAIVHDSPFRDLPSEVEVANDVLDRAHPGDRRPAAHPARLRVAHLGRRERGHQGDARRRGRDADAPRRASRRSGRSAGSPAGSGAGRRGPPTGSRRDAPNGRRWRRAGRRGAPTTRSIRWRARQRAGARHALPERESLERLAAAGVPVTPVRCVPADDGGDGAVAAWRELGGGPVAIKLDAVDLAHKTEAGGVRARRSRTRRRSGPRWRSCGRRRSATASPSAASSSSRWRRAGIEIIVGGRRDAVFGPAVLVGLGGILAEVLDDVAVLLAPVTVRRGRGPARGHSRGAALLRGVRGAPGVAMRPLAEVVVAVGDLLVADPSIVEIDCNPVIAGPIGAVAVDGLVVVEDASG